MKKNITRMILITLSLLLASLSVVAQEATTSEPAPPTPEPVATTTVAFDDSSSHEIRNSFSEVLRRYPPELSMVLKLDPTLLEDPGYLATYPALARFVVEYPQVAHNPAFYLEAVQNPNQYSSPSMRAFENIVESLTIFTFILTFILLGTWLVRTFVEQRRWSRLSRVQTEVHGKILDRLTSNEDLLSYIQTTAGKKFLESAPIPVGTEGQSISAPINRILWSVQLGVVVAAGAVGLMWVSGRFEAEVAQSLSAMGVIGLCVGLGFILSAGASLALSHRLGLWGSGEPNLSGTE